MTETILRLPTDSGSRRTPFGPRWAEAVPCPLCHKDRWIYANRRHRAEFADAAVTPCRSCSVLCRWNGYEPTTELPPSRRRQERNVPCPQCGQDRVMHGSSDAYFAERAKTRCSSCAARNRNYVTPRVERLTDAPSMPAAKLYEVDEDVVDWVVVERLMTGRFRGDWRSCSRAERLAAVAKLTAQGMTAGAVSQRLGVTQRTVVRLRATIRQAAAEKARIADWAAAWAGPTPPAATAAPASYAEAEAA